MLRKARIKDVPTIQKLINNYAKKDLMLPRSLNEIYENIRDYAVIESKKKIVGCIALHFLWNDLAEIKSLAISQRKRGEGLGTTLVQFALNEAKELGVDEVFALTYVPEFFEKLGFKKVAKDDLPRKVWYECVRCVKFPNCKEIPVVYQL